MELQQISIETQVEIDQSKVCIICKDETITAYPHTCNRCVEDNWYICPSCSEKLENEPCPVCRNLLEQIPMSPRVRNIPLHMYEIWKKYIYITLPLSMLLCFFLGKSYIWIYCQHICSALENECTCINHNGKQYWIDTDNFFHSIIIGFIVSTILTLLLCYRCIIN